MTHQVNLKVKAKHFHGTDFKRSDDCALAKASKDHFKGFKAYEMIDKLVIESYDDPTLQYVYTHESYNQYDFNADETRAGKWYNRILKNNTIRTVQLNAAHGIWTYEATGEQFHAINGRLTRIPIDELLTESNIHKYGYHKMFQAQVIMGTTVEVPQTITLGTPYTPTETPVEPIEEITEEPQEEITTEPHEEVISDDELQRLLEEPDEVEAHHTVLNLYLIE